MSAQGTYRFYSVSRQTILLVNGEPLGRERVNIVQQAISALKAAIKADIRRPEQQEQMNNKEEARRQGIALGNFRTRLLFHTPNPNPNPKHWHYHGS